MATAGPKVHRNNEETSRRAKLPQFTLSKDDFNDADGDSSLTSARLRSKKKKNTREGPADSTKILQERSCMNVTENTTYVQKNKTTQKHSPTAVFTITTRLLF